MTRWARGGSANRKKPLDASKWTEMTSDASDLHANTAIKKKRANKQSVPQKFKNVSESNQKTPVQSYGLQQNVVNELEKLGKESALAENLSESVLLEEFVHKDARREARRIKRQEQKRQARVCAVYTYTVTENKVNCTVCPMPATCVA